MSATICAPAAHELGQPVNLEWLLKTGFQRIRVLAKLRRITLHETRHTANSLLEKLGVPDSIRAAWCGHAVQVNRTTYLHVNPADLAIARDALASAFKIAEA